MASLAERKAEYDTHAIAGSDFYNTFRSQLTLDIEAGSKTLPQVLAIKNKIRCIGMELKDGDWKSAYHLASMLTSDVNFTDDMLSTMKTDIGSYISTNYTW